VVNHSLDEGLATALVKKLLDVGPVVLVLLRLVEAEKLGKSGELEVTIEVLRFLEDSDS